MADQARNAAYQTLWRVEHDGAFSNLANAALRTLPALDAAFATALVMGVTEKRRALDFMLDRHLQRAPEEELRILLRLGAFQIFYMDRVPNSAACDETVSIARERFGAKRAGFVNAVLRALVRDQEPTRQALERQPLAVRYSCGDGIAALFQADYPDQAEAILQAFNVRQPLHIRANTLHISASELADRLHAEADGTLLTVTEKQAEVVRGAQSGDYLIQGYGSQMAVRMLGAQPGETVLDVCACPGGKSLGAAIDMQNRGSIISMDIHANKLPLIQKQAECLGISIIRCAEHDARTPDPAFIGKADRVICDVPCSGLGVIASKPEIRYKDPETFAGLYPTQRKILDASAHYLRPGGVLVYSTCTFNRKENQEAVHAFLEQHPAFSLEAERTYFPFEEAGEGFYCAKFVRHE